MYLVSVSLSVIIISIFIAFSPWSRAMRVVLVKVPLAFIAEYSGLKGRQQIETILNRKKRNAEKRRDEMERTQKEKMQEEARAKSMLQAPRYLVNTFHNGPRTVSSGDLDGRVSGIV
ncbi:hypothetical protein BDZ45DRAFT_755288 [Acephala macrosclerotiorum]|nr:hypothetical protein BDZ45DRAFT_755288 [Acephala macrosclerotiorum]